MKKIIVCLLIAVIALSLFGCNAMKQSGQGDGGASQDGGASISADSSQGESESISQSEAISGSEADSKDDSGSQSEETSYTVTLVLSGGTIAGNRTTITVVYGEDYDLGVPEKSESQFDGWYNGETKIETSGVWQYREDMTLTARWKNTWSPIV